MKRDARTNYGYRIVAACGVIQAVSLGGIFTFGVLFPELEAEFGWSRTAISGASSFAFFLMGACAVVMGRAGDRFGPRVLLSVAGVFVGLGYALFYRIGAIWELYVYFGLFFGIGIAAHDVGTLSTVTRWFDRRRGLMTGIVKAGGGAGQALVPIFVAALIAESGWRIACLTLGLAIIVLQVGASQILRRNPEQLGLRSYGDSQSDAGPANDPTEEAGHSFKQAVRAPALWKLCMAKLCDLFCLFTVIIHIVPHAVDHGMAQSTAAGILSTVGAMSILGRLVLGALFDRIGSRLSLMSCFALLAVSLLILQFAASGWALFLFAVIYGPAHGGFFTLTSPSVAEFFGTRMHGTLFGLVVSCGTFGATLGPLVAGTLYDSSGSYGVAFALLLGVSLLGLLIAATLPRSSEGSHRRRSISPCARRGGLC